MFGLTFRAARPAVGLGISASRMIVPNAFRVAQKSYSTAKDPKAVAQSLVDMFPGSNMVQKSGSVLIASSLAAYIVSKEIYILDHEFFEMICIFGAYYIWFTGGKDAAANYFKERQSTIRNVLNQARADHKAVVQERIAHIGKMSDVVENTQGLYQISREIAQLEASAYTLKQTVNFNNEIRNTLDAWVRHEAGVRQREQSDLANAIIAKVKAQLADPKIQQQIFAQTMVDIEKIAKA